MIRTGGSSTSKGESMYFRAKSVRFAIGITVLLCLLVRPAYAYADPGSGILALQILSSTAAGIVYLLRKRVRDFLLRLHWGKSGKGNRDRNE
jgi:hypothetical protein